MKLANMKSRLFLAIILNCITLAGFTQTTSSARNKQFNTDNGIAIGGYDPVAYFKQNDALKGKKELAVTHEGVTYYFFSSQNAADFKKNPGKYEPQYGGWCAYAMGKDGAKVEIDPETYKIVDGRLLVFYNKLFTNTLKSWNKDEASLKQSADANWKKLYHN